MSTARAIVLARGLGTRMRAADPASHLTAEQQRAADAGLKAMMPMHGRPFLDFVLGTLADAALRDVALVVAPEHDTIRRYYADEAPPVRLRLAFVVQREALGTADAVLAAEEWTAGDPFLTVNSDNLYPARTLMDLARLDEPGLPAFESDELVRSSNIPADRLRSFAVIQLDEGGYLRRIVEKPPQHLLDDGRPTLVSMNCWRFDLRIFDACRSVSRSPRGEFELPSAVNLAMQRGVGFKVVHAKGPVLDLSSRGDAAEVTRRIGGVIPAP
jgi:glucose-1-phosphate thymidylyltransferase